MFLTHITIVSSRFVCRSIPIDITKHVHDEIGFAKTILAQTAGYILGDSATWVIDRNRLDGGYYKNDKGDVLEITPTDNTSNEGDLMSGPFGYQD